ncbi:MAG: methyltransferase domain-containing protein [Planctomycetota bacterium]
MPPFLSAVPPKIRCSVRGCGRPLICDSGGMRCEGGHQFDRNRFGYWNLTQPQDRKSKQAGDHVDAVAARHRWVERDWMSTLTDAMLTLCPDLKRADSIVDLGCGEGYFTQRLARSESDSPGADPSEPEPSHAARSPAVCGMDLSVAALRSAAKRTDDICWVLANADRPLPLMDRSVQCVVSLFGRRPAAEIQRVLQPGGAFVFCLPGEEDLIELRQAVQSAGHRRSRWAAAAQAISDQAPEMSMIRQSTWRRTAHLDQGAIADAMAMTYRGVRRSQRERLHALPEMTVTLSADIVLMRRNANGDDR